MYFVPVLRQTPLLGRPTAKKWLWTLDLSPGFIGQGIITGPTITIHMLMGTIVGWGILSPLAKNKGWAPGDVGSWDDGSRGWIVWVSRAALLVDSVVKLAWFLIRPLWRNATRSRFAYARAIVFCPFHIQKLSAIQHCRYTRNAALRWS